MPDYLIVKGQIDPIENEIAPEIFKANEWQKLERIVRTIIRMHLSESTQLRTELRQPKPNLMASISGSSEMSLRRFDGSNFNFWKEQMQDYLIVMGQIDPIENEIAPEIYKAN